MTALRRAATAGRTRRKTSAIIRFAPALGGKWFELLSEIAPGLKRAAIMFNPDTATASSFMPSLETAARSLKVEPITAAVHGDEEIETAIIALVRTTDRLIVAPRTPTPASLPAWLKEADIDFYVSEFKGGPK
jgi:putative ABC transport system substrate-binding protein